MTAISATRVDESLLSHKKNVRSAEDNYIQDAQLN